MTQKHRNTPIDREIFLRRGRYYNSISFVSLANVIIKLYLYGKKDAAQLWTKDYRRFIYETD